MIPVSWKVAGTLFLVTSVALGAMAYRSHVWHAGYDQATSERAAADLRAMAARNAENAATAAKQDMINRTVTKAHDEELTPVRARIAANRVRVGPALCSGLAAPAKAEDASSSHEANPAGGLVRGDLERDIRALKEEVEASLAAGRACQAWGRANGFAP